MGAGKIHCGGLNKSNNMKNLLLVFLTLVTVNCFAQNTGRPGDAEKVIVSFFREIQSDSIDPEKIWIKYIWLESQNDINIRDKMKIFTEQIQSRRSQKCTQCVECQNCKFDFEDESLTIKKLKDVDMHHLNFPDTTDYEIFVVVQRDEILQYVSLRDNKIAGFYTIKSTSDSTNNSFFLGY